MEEKFTVVTTLINVNIKNLFEYNPSYTESVGTNEFCFLGITRNAEK